MRLDAELDRPAAEVRFSRALQPGGLRSAELTLVDIARMADLAERYAGR